ncbi:DMT family transporter [Mesorhizobium sp. VNQ89]|uniref:DMT family transporter n=1 Tax=Mesorhizobium quangtriensis TaxID=3157709 RepID=UPI0032B7A807
MSASSAHHSNPLLGIGLKIASVSVFVGMSAFLKAAGQLPAGQLVFFRSFFAILPVLIYLAYRGDLRMAVYTKRPMGHVMRGVIGVSAMGLSFFALTRLPLPEAVTINYAQPLFVVMFSALFLGEAVRFYRWSAVVVGLIGVLIVSWPNLSMLGSGGGMENGELAGVIAAFCAAAMAAVAMLQVRSLVQTEKSAVIVIWFSLTASVFGLLTMPFGWKAIDTWQIVFLVSAGFCGGIAQILMTEAYRHAEASTVAPFEYTSIILAIAVGYVAFGEQPTVYVILGGAIVVAAGIFIVWRERQLGIERRRAKQTVPPQ